MHKQRHEHDSLVSVSTKDVSCPEKEKYREEKEELCFLQHFGRMESDEFMEKALPLINKTAVFLYTLCDLFKPGQDNVLQSALPLYQLILISTVFVVWLVVFLYYWKMVYYVVDDPYATPYGPAPPNKRNFDVSAYGNILNYIYNSGRD